MIVPKSWWAHLTAWLKQHPIYPVLIGWYPVLFFYQSHIREVAADKVLEPMAVVTVVVVVAFLLLRLAWSRWDRAAACLAVLLMVFFSHGYLLSGLGQTLRMGPLHIATNGVLLLAWGFLSIGSVIALKRRPQMGRRLVGVGNNIGLALIGLCLIQIAAYAFLGGHAPLSNAEAKSPDPRPTSTSKTADTNQPDVYYFIFDKHASAQTLKDQYGYDEQPFIDQLTKMGFYVATDAHTNYPKTSFSISSSLNMDYLSSLVPQAKPTSTEATTVNELFGKNAVGSFLQQRGYTYYNLGSWFTQTQNIAEANVNIHPGPEDYLEFDTFNTRLLNTTLYPTLVQMANPSVPSLNWIDQHRAWADYQYEQIPNLIAQPGPKFVFVHVLQPHNPFVYDANCQPIAVDKSGPEAIPYYRDQVTCTDQHILSIMKQVLAQSKTPPIIALQADEGPEAMANPLPNAYTFKNASLDSIKERTSILNAYYLPGQQPAALSPSITPVNSFRMIFDQYFGADYPILPNRTYVFQDDKHLFTMTDVTEQLGVNP